VWWATRPQAGGGGVQGNRTRHGRVDDRQHPRRDIEACQRTKLSTITGGRIEVLAVKEGDRVEKGQLLMKLWNDDQQAQTAWYAAQVATARQRVNEACTVAANAEREAERQASLRAKGLCFAGQGGQRAQRVTGQGRRLRCRQGRRRCRPKRESA
jgi:HlyD family secretion protein